MRVLPPAAALRPALVSTAVAAVAALALVLPGRVVSARAAPDRRPYDTGVQIANALTPGAVSAQSLQFFTDCEPGDFGGCGGPPGHWAAPNIPVQFCTMEAYRPATITAQQFRDAVTAAATMWNGTDVGVGIQYNGDCTTGTVWEPNDHRNEIAFDDSRHVVSGSTAGVARGTWVNIPPTGTIQDRQFTEFDIVLDSQMNVPDRCFRSIVAHEMGHALGLGHSTNPSDLMYPTFDPNDPNSCSQTASAADRALLVQLYGVDMPPAVAIHGPQSAFAGTMVSLGATATEPEGDPVTYQWTQVSGPPVTLVPNGASATFDAPDAVGGVVDVRVTALDPYLHASTADLNISIGRADHPPQTAPSLESFLPSNGAAMLNWGPVPNAATYQFCAGSDCSTVQTPSAPVDWPVTISAPGSATDVHVLTSGAKATTLAACNTIGCSTPGAGPLAGGVQWPAWGIDFDYLAWAYDVPQAGLRFTIGGVVNASGPARKFTIYTGTAADPEQTLVKSCGVVAAGGACVGVLMPQQTGHGSLLTIVSEEQGTPTVRQQVTIRPAP